LYYESIIRTEASLGRISRYIKNNPTNWIRDQLISTEPNDLDSALLSEQAFVGDQLKPEEEEAWAGLTGDRMELGKDKKVTGNEK